MKAVFQAVTTSRLCIPLYLPARAMSYRTKRLLQNHILQRVKGKYLGTAAE
jgi:hypothetical protein